MTYARIKDKPKKLLALTDLTRIDFDALLEAFNHVSKPKTKFTQHGKPRQRKPGGGY